MDICADNDILGSPAQKAVAIANPTERVLAVLSVNNFKRVAIPLTITRTDIKILPR